LDNGAEFVLKDVRDWIGAIGAKTAHIEPGSRSYDRCNESFNARFGDELLDGEIF
jgi:putative transposase